MEEGPSRQLAVLLHADVVGSTALVQLDETLAHQRIQGAFRRFSEIIASHGGTVHEIRGDALIAEFPRASDAVSAAVAFQNANTAHDEGLGDDVLPVLRVGIAMGEVVVADNTVTGEGIVLAQRLEQLAEPGGVCIQDAAYQIVPKRLPFEYESLGEQEVKGFAEPVRVYRVLPKSVTPTPSLDLGSGVRQTKSVWQRVAGAVVVLLIVVAVGLAWWQPWQSDQPEDQTVSAPLEQDIASVERMAFPLPDKPSIAVLPFSNISDDPSQDYFADGMTEDLITDLSKISGLFVIARNSSFSYKGQQVKVRQVAEDLGVRYVLEGSVRRAGDQVRINAQLIDATTGGHLWAERYDGTLADVFALQDEVTLKIVTALAVNLTSSEEDGRRRRETDNPEAYDAFLEGWTRYRQYTPDDFAKAIPYLKRAIELDPGYSRAHAALALVYAESWWNAWSLVLGIQWEVAIGRARRHLEVALKDPSPLAHRVATLLHAVDYRYDEAVAEAELGIALDPNNPHGHDAMARILILADRAAESLDFISIAQRLDPQTNYLNRIGEAQFNLGRYEEAAETLHRYTQVNKSLWEPFMYLAATYGHLGRHDEGRSTFQTMDEIYRSLRPDRRPFRAEQLRRRNLGQSESRLKEGLGKLNIFVPPEVVEASPEGITLKKADEYSPVSRIYEVAAKHCESHGKMSTLISFSFPNYKFRCY